MTRVMKRSSSLFQHIALVLSAIGVLIVITWIGFRIFETVNVPPLPPPKTRATFDSRTDVSQHPLWGTLQAVLRGSIEPGPVIGVNNPFASRGATVPGTQVAAGLGSVMEVPLPGFRMVAASRAKDGALLALVQADDRDAVKYEIRRYVSAEEAPTTVGRWTLAGITEPRVVPEALIPVALQQDGFGGIRLLSRGGHIGALRSDGIPLWGATPLFTSVSGEEMDQWGTIALDGSGYVWATDGRAVVREQSTGLSFVDVLAPLSDTQRSQVSTSASPLWHLQPLAGGDMMVFSSTVAERFFHGSDRSPDVTASVSTMVAVAPSGDLWSVSQQEGGTTRWFRQSQGTTTEYADALLLPKQASRNPMLIAAGVAGLMAVDYAPDATVLWKTAAGGWVAEVVIPGGNQPADSVDRLVADGKGNVWALMSQKGLLLVRAATTVQ